MDARRTFGCNWCNHYGGITHKIKCHMLCFCVSFSEKKRWKWIGKVCYLLLFFVAQPSLTHSYLSCGSIGKRVEWRIWCRRGERQTPAHRQHLEVCEANRRYEIRWYNKKLYLWFANLLLCHEQPTFIRNSKCPAVPQQHGLLWYGLSEYFVSFSCISSESNSMSSIIHHQ